MPLRQRRRCWHTDRRPARPAVVLCRKPSLWILVAVTVLVLALFGLAIGVALTTQDHPTGALDTALEGVTVSAETTTAQEPEQLPEPVGDRRCWRTFGADPQAVARAPDGDARPACAKVHVVPRARQLCRVPAGLLRGRAVRQRILGHDVRARRGHGPDQMDAPGGRNAPVEPCDRRSARPRRLAGRNGYRTQQADRAADLAGADGRKGRVVPGRGRRARVLRLARRPTLRRASPTPVAYVGRTRPADASTRAPSCSADACA